MTADRAWGPLAWRLLAAFVAAALSSVLVMATGALVAADRGLAAAQETARQQTADQVAEAAGIAYTEAAGWAGARLERAAALAEGAGARLVVRDATGHTVRSRGGGFGSGPGGAGAGRVGTSAPVLVAGTVVGVVQLVFPAAAGSSARDVAWGWIGVAAAVALSVALLASWFVSGRIVRPLGRLATAARAMARGDRSVRSGVRAPGELGDLGRAFDMMVAEVSRAERARRALTADVAHELRTPLATLRAGLEELRDGFADPDPARLTSLHDQTLRLGRVVEDLAELAAAESAALSLRLADVDLATLARAALASHAPQLEAAGITARAELAESVVVRADADRLHQALGNLLGNAERYLRAGDSVTVRVFTTGVEAIVQVADSGPGIPDDALPHVFDRLWRGRGHREVAGSGIGLAVVRELVAAHGGTVEAASEPAGGATFTIRLTMR